MNTDGYLVLNPHPVQFEPVTSVNSVFFDEANKQIFTVRSGGATGVVVKGPGNTTSHTFQLRGEGSLISIKFSYRHEILALQRSDRTIEFIPTIDGKLGQATYSQSSKSQDSKILTFHWVSSNEVVFVAQNGVEFYQINQAKKEIKLLKSYSLPITWSTFLPESAMLLCHTPAKGGLLYPFYFKDSRITRLPVFDISLHCPPKNDQLNEMLERDVTMVYLYGSLYIAILRHSAKSSEPGTKVDLFMIKREVPAKKLYTLITGVAGRFAINDIDNLVVIHHQASRTSMIFDIHLAGEKRNSVMQVYPVVDPAAIRSHKIKVRGFSLNQQKPEVDCQLYAPTWIVFQPNIIIDAALGCMWFLQIKLDSIATIFKDVGRLIDFLLMRRGSKVIILKVLKKMVLSKSGQASYKELKTIFDKLNDIYKAYTEAEQVYIQARKQEASSGSSSRNNPYPPHRMQIVIDESDMYTHVLSIMARENGIDQRHVCRVVVEYIRSLHDHQLTVQHYLSELIINALIESKCFHLLEQYIQSGIIAASRTTGTYLLSKESEYATAYQLAIGMWKGLAGCNNDVVDALLSKHKILEAIRYVKQQSMQHTISARKFLEAARETSNDLLFYEAYKFFEARNHNLRGTKVFTPGEQCDNFVSYYDEKFGLRNGLNMDS